MLDDLQIPSFLDRRKYDENGKIIRSSLPDFVTPTDRVWAPIRGIDEYKRSEKIAMIWADNPDFPVQVVTTHRKNLMMFENFPSFKKFFDFDEYPVKRVVTAGDVTYVIVKESNTINLDDSIRSIETPKVEVTDQNGIKRPKPNSICGKAWALYDQSLNGGPSIEESFKVLAAGGMNGSTIRTQFSHWKKFNGLKK